MFLLKPRMTSEQRFWNWFLQYEPELFAFDPSQEEETERLFQELAGELRKVNPDLTFEIGPAGLKREFVVSAGGIKGAFSAVASLVETAPRLDRWQIIAFRPRRTVSHIVQFRNKRIDPRDVQFSLLDNGSIAGIYLYIPGYREDDVSLKQIGYLLLDETLGEYDVETRLGLIKMLPIEAPTILDRYPLSELPGFFDRLVARLEGRSERLS